MINTKNVSIILAVLFFSLNILLISKIKPLDKRNKFELENALNNETQCSLRLLTFKSNIKFTMESEFCVIDQITELIDTNEDTISISDIFKPEHQYLVFRYSYTACSSCISQITQLFYEQKDSLKNIEILFLPYYQTYRDLIVQNSSTFNKTFHMYMPLTNYIGLPIDKMDLPYLFFTNDGKTAKHLIIADVSDIEFLKHYLTTISKKYIKN
ncbi:MAG: hypothetical protein EPN88_09570 [Bacteroidetes bacterium]|nr:MAG: hypothetical protein EPN88_09570 [Bacteroidota bacterium]